MDRRFFGWLLLAMALLGFAGDANAQWWDPAGRGESVPHLDPEMGAPIVNDPWGDEIIRSRYRMRPGIGFFNRALEIVFYPFFDKPFNDFDDALAQRIADGCARTYAGDSWRQIRCASQAVDAVLGRVDLDKFPRTFCRAHARAFKEVVNRLEIPGVNVGEIAIVGAPGHVLNRLTVTTPDGAYFAYAIDTGWDPDKVYPLTDAARRWHDRNRDGRTDYQSLPPLPARGERIRYAFRPAAEPRGSNVSRGSDTRGAAARAPGSPVAGGASGAGTPRD